MYIEFLKKIRIFENKRCSLLSLFTTRHSIDEIRELKMSGRKIVCFGVDDTNWFYVMVLREVGIGPDIITDNGFKTLDMYLDNILAVKPAALLKEKEKYYFIITLKDEKFINQVRKQLLLWGVEDFAICTNDIMYDFDRAANNGLKDAFLKSFHKIYGYMDFTEDNFKQARYRYSHLMRRWGDSFEWVLEYYTGHKNLSLLDVGPGIGLASLMYKELLDVSINWINLKYNDICHRTSAETKIIESEKINNIYGYIEADEFEGLYDIILCTDIIEHFAYNPVNTLKKLHAMLKSEGRFIVDMAVNRGRLPYYTHWRDLPLPNKNTENKCEDVLKITQAGHVYEYTSEELNEIFIESGFKIIRQKINRDNPSLQRISCMCTKA